MTSDTCVSASAQISHHLGSAQLKWSCAVEVWCDYSTDLFSHFKTVLFQTFLSPHTKICWFVNDNNRHCQQWLKQQHTWMPVIVSVPVKLTCNQLAGNNPLMKCFCTGSRMLWGGHPSSQNHYGADSFLCHVNIKSISLAGWEEGWSKLSIKDLSSSLTYATWLADWVIAVKAGLSCFVWNELCSNENTFSYYCFLNQKQAITHEKESPV